MAAPWELHFWPKWAWADAAKKQGDSFVPSRAAEREYERRLLGVAKRIEAITSSGKSPQEIDAALRQYADLIEPWARQSAINMLAGVNRKNEQAWRSMARRMGHDMRTLLASPGIGQVVQQRIDENTRLIRSLALGAADRVNELAKESLSAGTRAEHMAKEIAHVGEVSLSKARTIARTEVSKAGTALTLARAESVGSTGYIWRTARDGDTRESHRAMEGVFVRWDSPPIIDGMRGHAGEFPNCRCYPEPVIPKADGKGVFMPALPTQAQEQNSGQQQLLSKWEQQEGSLVTRYVPGAPLPGVKKATFPMPKLTHYALDPDHPEGKHKAKVFAATLGLRKEHAELLHAQVMAWLPHAEAMTGEADSFGNRLNVTVPVTGPNGKTVDVLTGWFYKKDGNTIATRPTLTTIMVDPKSHAL